jgi:hypothetical protein
MKKLNLSGGFQVWATTDYIPKIGHILITLDNEPIPSNPSAWDKNCRIYKIVNNFEDYEIDEILENQEISLDLILPIRFYVDFNKIDSNNFKIIVNRALKHLNRD